MWKRVINVHLCCKTLVSNLRVSSILLAKPVHSNPIQYNSSSINPVFVKLLMFTFWTMWQRRVGSSLWWFFVVVLDCIKSYKLLKGYCIGLTNWTQRSSCLSPNHVIWPLFTPQETPKWNFISPTTHVRVITHLCICSSRIILPANTTHLSLYNNK